MCMFFIDGERKIFFKFIISTTDGLHSLFFSETQKKTLSGDMPENVSVGFFLIINNVDIQTRS